MLDEFSLDKRLHVSTNGTLMHFISCFAYLYSELIIAVT